MRVLLFGGNGQVGHAIQARGLSANEWSVSTRNDCDLRDGDCIRRLIQRVQPDLIVNAAAYTAVDKAENDREACFAVNANAPTVMAMEAAVLGAKLVHYSTDYVFDGRKAGAYTEEDGTGPQNVYGASKLAGERGIAGAGGDFLVLRTSWVYSNYGSNFLKTMLWLGVERQELRIVADQHGAPTSADAIAEATVRIVRNAEGGKWVSGLFHMTAAGATTWYGFAKAIFTRTTGCVPSLLPIATADYSTAALRPANSVLSNEKFAATFGFRLSGWEEQLDAVMAARPVVG